MARTITLGDLLSDIRWQANVEGFTDRHTDAQLTRVVNASWQRLRELVSDAGHPFFLRYVTGTMTAGAASGLAFGTIDYPSDAARIYGVDVTVQGDVIPLDPVPFSTRNAFQDGFLTGNSKTGVPECFAPYNIGTASTTEVLTGTIAILPAPDAAYSYAVWYLPNHANITDTSHVFNAPAGWDDWVLWDCVVRVSARDNDAQSTYAIAVRERDLAQQRLLVSAARMQSAAAGRRIDKRGQRQRARQLGEYWSR